MTKRKFLTIIIVLMMCVSLTSCSFKQSNSNISSEFGTLIFLERKQLNTAYELYQYIMYDPETMVMYTYMDGLYGGGFTVMYNADGTLKLYSPNTKAE